jgi:hypothetical protein
VAVLPAFCDNCGTLFGAAGIVGGTGNIILTGGTLVGGCPTCGNDARILDGHYQLLEEGVRILSAPAWSVEKLQWLDARLRAAQAGQATPEEVVQEVAAEAPELRETLDRLARQGWVATQVIAALIAIVVFVQSLAEPPATAEELHDATEQIIREIRERPVAPPGDVAPPRAKRPPPPPASARGRPKSRARKTHGQNKRRRPRK